MILLILHNPTSNLIRISRNRLWIRLTILQIFLLQWIYIYLNVISLNIKIYMDDFECKWQYLKLKKTYVTMQIKSFCTFAWLFSFLYMSEENKFLWRLDTWKEKAIQKNHIWENVRNVVLVYYLIGSKTLGLRIR